MKHWDCPDDLDYREVRGLSIEVQQKLNQHKPETIGQAARISGITPAAISLLLVHLKRGFREITPSQKARMNLTEELQRGITQLGIMLSADSGKIAGLSGVAAQVEQGL